MGSFRRCMSNNTLNSALHRLGYSKKKVSVSGFRTAASILLNEMGHENPDAIERQLAAMEENECSRAYMHVGVGSRIHGMMTEAEVSASDAWRRKRDNLPSRSLAIRRLIKKGGKLSDAGYDRS